MSGGLFLLGSGASGLVRASSGGSESPLVLVGCRCADSVGSKSEDFSGLNSGNTGVGSFLLQGKISQNILLSFNLL